MSKQAAEQTKKLVKDKLKDTEDRLDELLRKIRTKVEAQARELQGTH